MGWQEFDLPRPPSFRWARNPGRNAASHLREQLSLLIASVSHKRLSIRVFSTKVGDEIRVIDVGHPMVGIIPGAPMRSDFEGDFLWQWRV